LSSPSSHHPLFRRHCTPPASDPPPPRPTATVSRTLSPFSLSLSSCLLFSALSVHTPSPLFSFLSFFLSSLLFVSLSCSLHLSLCLCLSTPLPLPHTQRAPSAPTLSAIDTNTDKPRPGHMSSTSTKRSSMNPLAASFTPSLAKSGSVDCGASDYSGDYSSSNRPSRRSTIESSRVRITDCPGFAVFMCADRHWNKETRHVAFQQQKNTLFIKRNMASNKTRRDGIIRHAFVYSLYLYNSPSLSSLPCLTLTQYRPCCVYKLLLGDLDCWPWYIFADFGLGVPVRPLCEHPLFFAQRGPSSRSFHVPGGRIVSPALVSSLH